MFKKKLGAKMNSFEVDSMHVCDYPKIQVVEC